ncbi:MAG: hypothetical protein KGD67_07535 [Candidatus Lokiarchaeota archaeon]|nr:hypothetical protein [Candidatus Lokiarchaeota archaeon]
MEYNYFTYEKEECNITIHKLAKWFREETYEGDKDEGNISFYSQNDYDEIYGSNAKMEITWQKKDRNSFFHGKEVQNSIELYSSIGFAIINKESDWLLSHEFVTWFGQRTKMMRKRYYREKCIHGIFYCDVTERLINVHINIIDKFYDNFKPFIIKSLNTIICHE